MSDNDLVTAATRLAAEGRETTADLIALLAALDARKVYAAEGYSSIFAFCLARLRLSEEEAYYRIAAARAASRFPMVLEWLREGRLTLTSVALLRKHLTAENHARLLQAAEGQGKRGVQRLIATLAPLPDVPTSLRRLPGPRAAPCAVDAEDLTLAPPARADAAPALARRTSVPGREELSQLEMAPSLAAPLLQEELAADANVVVSPPLPPTAPARPAVIRPLAPARYSLQVTLSDATHTKLQRARDLLRHAVPDGDLAEVLDRALTVLLTELERKKFAATKRQPKVDSAAPTPSPVARRHRRRATLTGPGSEAGPPTPTPRTHLPDGSRVMPLVLRPRSRHIPAAVRRAVWRRDDGRCAFVGRDGRCTETGRLEFHHTVPFADGGTATVATTELRCTTHNLEEARRWFGEEVTRYRGRNDGSTRDSYPGWP